MGLTAVDFRRIGPNDDSIGVVVRLILVPIIPSTSTAGVASSSPSLSSSGKRTVSPSAAAGVGGKGVRGDNGKDTDMLSRLPCFHIRPRFIVGVSWGWRKREGKNEGGGMLLSNDDSVSDSFAGLSTLVFLSNERSESPSRCCVSVFSSSLDSKETSVSTCSAGGEDDGGGAMVMLYFELSVISTLAFMSFEKY